MAMKKKRTTSNRIDRLALRAAFIQVPSEFFWADLMTKLGLVVSETHLRHILLNEWKWVEATDQTRKTEVLRKGKLVGGRPQTVYRKTAAGEAAAAVPATMPR